MGSSQYTLKKQGEYGIIAFEYNRAFADKRAFECNRMVAANNAW